ncbi:MAG: hypothetical protein D6729_03560 [Deltaproteobacteria bacterium]|nr:MAG: hypothetical protein D6729_03560 [Deltaproteobacteria bacterium]
MGLCLVLLLAAPALRAETPPTARASDRAGDEGADLDLDDLGPADDLDPDVEAKLRDLLQEARRRIDAGDLDGARRTLDEADRLVPMHDEVLELLEVVGRLEDDAEKSAALLEQIEKERKAEAARARAARRGVERVLKERGLPKKLPRALRRLHGQVQAARDRVASAEASYDKCIGAAALAAAGGAAAACRTQGERVRLERKALRALEADLEILAAALRKRKGPKAVERILGKEAAAAQ